MKFNDLFSVVLVGCSSLLRNCLKSNRLCLHNGRSMIGKWRNCEIRNVHKTSQIFLFPFISHWNCLILLLKQNSAYFPSTSSCVRVNVFTCVFPCLCIYQLIKWFLLPNKILNKSSALFRSFHGENKTLAENLDKEQQNKQRFHD